MIKMWCCFSLATLRGLLETDVDDVDDAGVSSPDNIRVAAADGASAGVAAVSSATAAAAPPPRALEDEPPPLV